jgi:hypothetical protein
LVGRDGVVEVRRGESAHSQFLNPEQVEGIWRSEEARNPQLICVGAYRSRCALCEHDPGLGCAPRCRSEEDLAAGARMKRSIKQLLVTPGSQLCIQAQGR